MSRPEPERCERCGEVLDARTLVWRELNNRTGLYAEPGASVPAEESQGCFPFGRACSEQVSKAGGRLVRLARNRRTKW